MIEQISFKKGDVFLVEYKTGSPIDDVIVDTIESPLPSVVTEHAGVVSVDYFKSKVLCKLGHVEYRGIWPFRKRVTVLD